MERESIESLGARGERRGRVVFNKGAEDTEAHLYLLPWIGLNDPVIFGEVEVAPAPISLDAKQPCTPAARRIMNCYRGLSGTPVIPCLMWIACRGPLELSASDYETLRRHRICLSAALIMNDNYFDKSGSGPICDAHCDGYFHRFQSDVTYISLYRRRRDGVDQETYPIDRFSVTVPLSGSSQHQHTIDQSLLDALVTTISAESHLGRKLELSLPPFLQANRLNEQTSILDDLVQMGAAFERLFSVTGAIGKGLADEITSLFSEFRGKFSQWHNVSWRGRQSRDEGPWRRRWIREFYDRRSTIHSGVAREGMWSDLFHAVIAAEVFSLCTKMYLREAGIRPLTEMDGWRMEALDDRIEALSANPINPTVAWAKPLIEAQRRRGGPGGREESHRK